jgi:hypothetical protein
MPNFHHRSDGCLQSARDTDVRYRSAMRSLSDQSANIGTACHIYSASPGGARGTDGLTPEQRQVPENGIWCCANHGRLIDTNAGGRFPADLLRSGKLLHEARIHRELQGSTTRRGWVYQLEIVNSFLFVPSATFGFSKATLIRGEGSVGKTAICEWLTGFQDNSFLGRWEEHDHDLKLSLLSPEPTTLQLSIHNHQVQRFRDGTRSYARKLVTA